MAKRIKGISIEIDGETTGLDKALKKINGQTISLQSELRDVEKLLKFDPGNTELVAQKQQILAEQIEATTAKLDGLKQAEKQVTEQFQRGEIKADVYRNFQRELVDTESALESYRRNVEKTTAEVKNMEDGQKQLKSLLEATDSTLDDYSATLGSKLKTALENGTASSDDLNRAIGKIGDKALGTRTDIDKLKASLDAMDDGTSLEQLRQDLNDVETEADQAGDAAEGFGDRLGGVLAGLGAGASISDTVGKALDSATLDTMIDVGFNVSEEGKQNVKSAISTVQTYGIDAESALEGVRRQWALNADASDETNARIVKQAGVISAAYADIDFSELIQETNEISEVLKISDEDALALTNSLLEVGFPPDQLDIIAEYGTQLQAAGYDAEEVQAIMAAGVDTGTWNIDSLLDGLKEGRIRMSEFGQEVDDEMASLVEQTGLSASEFQKYGEEIAKGGEGGKKALEDVAKWLTEVDDKTLHNTLGTEIFGRC